MFGLFKGAQDRQLNAELEAMHRRVKLELSSEDRERLYVQLIELREAGIREAAATGMNGKQCSRMLKGAAIQTMSAFIEIDRMFAPPGTRPRETQR